MPEDKSALEKLEDMLKMLWKKSGQASVIAARHTEFVVEPKVFLGNKLNPEILKALIMHYLANTSKQDSGAGNNIETTPDKMIIKSPKGKPLVIVRDKKIIKQFLAQSA
ncbi:MAG: hypothetical protein HQ596_07660 [Candidatus Saganbacteria bacterium]|nr:hypothetical protein [Candidatus Saganbacteria bacterium]